MRVQSNIRLKFGIWFKRRILHAPNWISQFGACEMRRLNQFEATQWIKCGHSRIFDWSRWRCDWSDLAVAFHMCQIKCIHYVDYVKLFFYPEQRTLALHVIKKYVNFFAFLCKTTTYARMSCSKTDFNFWRRPLCCSILNVHRLPIRQISQTRQIVSSDFDLILEKTSLSVFLASCKHCANSRLNCTAWKPCVSKCSREPRGSIVMSIFKFRPESEALRGSVTF